MTNYLSNIGPHIILDKLSPEALERIYVHVEKTKPEFVTVAGGARFTQAVGVAREFKTNKRFDPNPNVILRKLVDDGNWQKPQYKDPDDWYKEYQPYVKEGFLMLASNEDMTEPLTDYSFWLSRNIDNAGADGGGIAAGSFSTGNPHEYQFTVKEMGILAERFHVWHDYSVYNPHEYFGLTDATTAGHPGRWKKFVELSKSMGLTPPRIVVGETGLLINIDPYLGYSFIHMPGEEYYKRLKKFNQDYYLGQEPHADEPINLEVFCYGEWYSSPYLHVNEPFMEEFENDISSNAFISIPPRTSKQKYSLPETLPPSWPIPEDPILAVCIDDNVRIRRSPEVGQEIGRTNKDDRIKVLEPVNQALSKIGSAGEWLYVETITGIRGWTAAWFYQVLVSTPPDTEPSPDPGDPPINTNEMLFELDLTFWSHITEKGVPDKIKVILSYPEDKEDKDGNND